MKRDLTELPPVTADRRAHYGEDPNQFFDIWNARGQNRGALMMIHGGFWRAKYDLTHASFFCEAMAVYGFTVANVEYRRVGNTGGGWPGTFADILAASRAIQHELSQQNLIVAGHSAGGHLALLAASELTQLKGVIALAPVAVLATAYNLQLSNGAVAEFMGGTPQQQPLAYVAACPSKHELKAPAFVIQGDIDDVVPVEISREYIATQTMARLIELPQTGHMELIDPTEVAFRSVVEALETLLR